MGKIAELLAEFTGVKLSPEGMANRFALVSRDPEQKFVVASSNQKVIGFLGFRIRHNLESVSHYGEVATIVVDSKWRKRQVGSQLIEYAETLARKHQCIGLWLVSGFGREAGAHKFYGRKGFVRTGIRFVKRFDMTQ